MLPLLVILLASLQATNLDLTSIEGVALGSGIASGYRPWRKSPTVPYARYPGAWRLKPRPWHNVCAHRTAPFWSILKLTRADQRSAYCVVLDRVIASRSKLAIRQARLYAKLLCAEAKKYKLDPIMLTALIDRESRWNRKAVSARNYGLMQIRVSPTVHSNYIGKERLLFSAKRNIQLGAKLLSYWRSYHYKHCGDDHYWWSHYQWGKVVNNNRSGKSVRMAYSRYLDSWSTICYDACMDPKRASEFTKIVECKACSKTFLTWKKNGKQFCSKVCAAEGKRYTPKGSGSISRTICSNCGKRFTSYKYRKRSFCSLDCAYEARSGSASKFWIDGTKLAQSGYRLVQAPDHPNARSDGYVLEHRLVAEELLGRHLKPNEIVHHIDGNKLNNASSNIEVVSRASHQNSKHKQKRDSTGRFNGYARRIRKVCVGQGERYQTSGSG